LAETIEVDALLRTIARAEMLGRQVDFPAVQDDANPKDPGASE
jgi:hypothetical protein